MIGHRSNFATCWRCGRSPAAARLAARRSSAGHPERVGELLLRHAGPIIDRFQSAKADLAAFSEGAKSTLRIGAYEGVSARILPAILGVFAANWPKVEIDLRDSSDKDLLTLVEAGELDLAFVMDSEVLSDGFKTTELLKDPY